MIPLLKVRRFSFVSLVTNAAAAPSGDIVTDTAVSVPLMARVSPASSDRKYTWRTPWRTPMNASFMPPAPMAHTISYGPTRVPGSKLIWSVSGLYTARIGFGPWALGLPKA